MDLGIVGCGLSSADEYVSRTSAFPFSELDNRAWRYNLRIYWRLPSLRT